MGLQAALLWHCADAPVQAPLTCILCCAQDIVRAVRPTGRSKVPDTVKAELLAEVKKFVLQL